MRNKDSPHKPWLKKGYLGAGLLVGCSLGVLLGSLSDKPHLVWVLGLAGGLTSAVLVNRSGK